MMPIHVVQKLGSKLTEEEVRAIVDFARGGFILEPDLTENWKRSTEIVVTHLKNKGLPQEASDFAERQLRMADYRSKALHCLALDGGKFACEINNGAVEFLITDGLNVGRFCLKVNSGVGNAWQDGLEHDIFVIGRMLHAMCRDKANGEVLVEGSDEYVQWMDGLTNPA
ncbi:MAG: hypothetical protein Q8K86_08270 [Candidatus Nanopelagicaceae bacterium]|nr:hypothetical protein [Candidatus Nanopelagicaceae bacterium]